MTLAAGAGALKSPATGTAYFGPNTKVPALGVPALVEFRSRQVAVFGSTVPMLSFPSPFQSPTTGRAFFGPYQNWPTLALPALGVWRSFQVELAGVNVPMPSFLSPFQSPTTGTYAPNWKVPRSAGPADGVERNDQVEVVGRKAPMPDDDRSLRSSSNSMDRRRPLVIFRCIDLPPRMCAWWTRRKC